MSAQEKHRWPWRAFLGPHRHPLREPFSTVHPETQARLDVSWESAGNRDAVRWPTRRAILDLLRERGDATAGEIGDEFPSISRPAVSKHLRVLREASLIEERRDGRFVRYHLAVDHLTAGPDAWLEPFRRAWAEKLVDLRRYVEGRENGPLP